MRFFLRYAVVVLTLAFAALGNLASAQDEPSLHQIYEAAQAGHLDQAQQMMAQVLKAHPTSAKAHFVKAELSARQGNISQAREELATAERLAPGLPFAKADAVQSLHNQLAPKISSQSPVVYPSSTPAPSAPFPWTMVLLVGGGIAIALFIVSQRKSAPRVVAQSGYPAPNSLSGPQVMGRGGDMAVPPMPAPGYPQASSGLGSGIVGGLATGLAVGAGVVAAEAIGRSLMGGGHHSDAMPQAQQQFTSFEPIAANADMGGQDFGVTDASSWSDGSLLAGGDGGSDWDS